MSMLASYNAFGSWQEIVQFKCNPEIDVIVWFCVEKREECLSHHGSDNWFESSPSYS